jgi:hypothetical protein
VEVRVTPQKPGDEVHPGDAAPRPWDVPDDPAPEGSGVGSVPESVLDAARRAFDAGPASAEVADLVFDSLLDEDPAGLAFADPAVRRLHFGVDGGERGARVTASEHGESVRVTLQVLPPAEATVEVRSKGITFVVRTGQNGVIQFDVLPGLVSLLITPVRSLLPRPLQTAWVRL